MAIIKQYSHDNKISQITCTLSKDICENFKEISIVFEKFLTALSGSHIQTSGFAGGN